MATEIVGKCGCGRLATQKEFDRNRGECNECVRLTKLGNGDYQAGVRKEREAKAIEENKKLFASRKVPLVKKTAFFSSGISTITVSITPYLQGCVALPIPSKAQEKMQDVMIGGWRGVVELVVNDMKDEPGVTCENAMEMSFACSFTVELQGKETPNQAERRVKKAFIKSWNKIVSNVEKGRSLKD